MYLILLLTLLNMNVLPWQVPVLHPEDNTAVSIDDPSAPFTTGLYANIKR